MKKTFTKKGTFQSYYKACEWLQQNRYSYGSMCGKEPIGIIKGDVIIAKWRNLSDKYKLQLDGTMTSSDFREGSVTIEITSLN